MNFEENVGSDQKKNTNQIFQKLQYTYFISILAPSQRRSQFFKLNKSSSMHDLAQEEAHLRMRGNNEMNNGINGGISWMDEPWNTTQSTMNHPTMNIQELLGMAH